MKKLTKSVAVVLGMTVLATTPVQSFAASYRAMPELTQQGSIVENVHRRRYRHSHRRNNSGRGGCWNYRWIDHWRHYRQFSPSFRRARRAAP